MEYIYAAMLLNKSGKEITEANVKKVLEAAGAKPDSARIKALIVALEGVDIEEIITNTPTATTSQPATSSKEDKKEEKAPETKKEDKKEETESAAAGMGALFG